MGYPGYAKIYERLTNGLYLRKMVTEFHKFIRHCSKCLINQTPKYRPYGSLQSIFVPVQPFRTFTIDFIFALSISIKSFNCAMSVTDKFKKEVIYIYGITSWFAKQWVTTLFDRLTLLNWKIPKIIISNKNKKFVSDFWKQISDSLNVNLIYFITWHF